MSDNLTALCMLARDYAELEVGKPRQAIYAQMILDLVYTVETYAANFGEMYGKEQDLQGAARWLMNLIFNDITYWCFLSAECISETYGRREWYEKNKDELYALRKIYPENSPPISCDCREDMITALADVEKEIRLIRENYERTNKTTG